jgi:hypothetical protein
VWQNWQRKADAATLEVIKKWEDWKLAHPNPKDGEKPDIEFASEIWGELKEWLLVNVFHEKCAYCESRLTRSSGHAEHFRPKGRVKAKGNGVASVMKTSDENGNRINHPGYFWLAYNWKNLLPSCEKCNTSGGKGDQFPATRPHILGIYLKQREVAKLKAWPRRSPNWNGYYYLEPEDLNEREDPLILHPYFDNPREHLRFGDGGVVAAVDGKAKGAPSISVYNLDSDLLRTDRQDSQEKAESRYFAAWMATRGTIEQKKRKAEEAVASFREGLEPFSAAALDYLELVRK